MGWRGVKDLVLHPQSMRTYVPTIKKAFSSMTTCFDIPLCYNSNKPNVQTSKIKVLKIDLEQNEPTPVSKKKVPPELILAAYLVNAQSYLGI